jgi:hypothetical protein
MHAFLRKVRTGESGVASTTMFDNSRKDTGVMHVWNMDEAGR